MTAQTVDGATLVGDPAVSPLEPTGVHEGDAPATLSCELGFSTTMPALPVPRLRLLTEVQTDTATIGWGVVDIFDPEGHLIDGAYRIVLSAPPVDVRAPPPGPPAHISIDRLV